VDWSREGENATAQKEGKKLRKGKENKILLRHPEKRKGVKNARRDCFPEGTCREGKGRKLISSRLTERKRSGEEKKKAPIAAEHLGAEKKKRFLPLS